MSNRVITTSTNNRIRKSRVVVTVAHFGHLLWTTTCIALKEHLPYVQIQLISFSNLICNIYASGNKKLVRIMGTRGLVCYKHKGTPSCLNISDNDVTIYPSKDKDMSGTTAVIATRKDLESIYCGRYQRILRHSKVRSVLRLWRFHTHNISNHDYWRLLHRMARRNTLASR